ncbi:MAG: type 4a pilus biogenesis protein PilO [Desulfovibrionales bacterium]
MDREALVKKLEKLSPAQKIFILLATLILIGGGYWYFFFQAASQEMASLRSEMESLEKDIDGYQKIIAANLPMIEKELEIKLRQFKHAKALLPESNVEKERLLASIEKLARDEGLEFRLYQPGGESAGELFATTSIQLDMNGEFHSLMRFFSRMSNLDRLVSLENLSLSPISGKNENVILLSAKSKILLYRALSEAELAAREEQKKPQKKKKKK